MKRLIYISSIIIVLLINSYCNKKNIQSESELINIRYNVYRDKNNKNYYFKHSIPQRFTKKNDIGELIDDVKTVYFYDSTLILNEKEVSIKDVIDIESYENIEDDYFKDAKNVYVKRNTNIKPKFCVININPKEFKLIGSYIKDSNRVFYNSKELDNVKASKFKSITFFKDGLSTEIGYDLDQIYFMGKTLKLREIEDLPINKSDKDSLIQLWKIKRK